MIEAKGGSSFVYLCILLVGRTLVHNLQPVLYKCLILVFFGRTLMSNVTFLLFLHLKKAIIIIYLQSTSETVSKKMLPA